MQYSNFIEVNENYIPSEKTPSTGKLPPGVYDLNFNERSGQLFFTKSKITSDSLLDLPSPEYSQVISEIDHFLKPTTREVYKRFGYIYKRSTLLYGVPGTGKTCIANRVAQKVVEKGGVVLFNPHPNLLEKAFEVLDSIQPEVTTMVIFEELDQLLRKYNEGSFLSLLDGEVQKENVIYVATTNFVEKIPDRIRRPGRFSTVLEVEFPTAESRRFYLRNKGVDEELIEAWVEKTGTLSIDELKETVLAVYCLDQRLEDVIVRLGKNKALNTVKSVGIEPEPFTFRLEGLEKQADNLLNKSDGLPEWDTGPSEGEEDSYESEPEYKEAEGGN